MTMNAKWLAARAQMRVGDRVQFVTEWDIYPYTIVPAGTVGTVTEISDDTEGMVMVLPDDTGIRKILEEWDGAIQVYCWGDDDDEELELPIAKVVS